MNKCVWEIYVPCQTNEGKPIRTRQHREWDKRVRKISGGLTILKPAVGQWIDPESDILYRERMIPVRIVATKEEIEQIGQMTKKFYEQIAVLVYKISDDVMFL